MAASEELLGLLHNIVAEDLIRRIRGVEVKNEAGEVTGVIAASASDIANAIKLLKDNAITCKPAADNAMGRLAQQLAQREAGVPVSAADAEDLRAALNDVGHSAMRPN